jgi:hypothetical protein
VHLLSGLIAYTKLPKKPSLKIEYARYQPSENVRLMA